MNGFVKVGSVYGREVHLLEVPDFCWISPELDWPAGSFVTLLTADARGVDSERIANAARTMLDAGCAYFCTWGPRCKHVHDVIDEVRAIPDPNPSADTVVMTTWHDDESLDEALCFLLSTACPAESFIDTWRGLVVITVNPTDSVRGRVASALVDAHAFLERMWASDDG